MSIIVFDAKHLRAGVAAGLVGGIVFGAMMGMMGMLPMVAGLVGSSSGIVGFVVHLIFSAIIGAIFSVFFGHEAQQAGRGILSGLVYGLLWWVLGPLLIMPIWMGMGAQLSVAGMQMALPSLWGHLVYGFILGLIYQRMSQVPELASNEAGEQLESN